MGLNPLIKSCRFINCKTGERGWKNAAECGEKEEGTSSIPADPFSQQFTDRSGKTTVKLQNKYFFNLVLPVTSSEQ